MIQSQNADTEQTQNPDDVWPPVVKTVAEMEQDKAETKRKELDAHDSALFLEFLERGDFHRHLCNASVAKTRFPDRVLWELFECCWSPSPPEILGARRKMN